MWHYRQFSSEHKFLVKLTKTETSYQLEALDIKFRRWKESPTRSQLEIRCQELRGIELDPSQLISTLEQGLLLADDRNVKIVSVTDQVLELLISKMVLKIDYKLKLESVEVPDSLREWMVENFMPLFALYASRVESPLASQSSSDSQEFDKMGSPRQSQDVKTFEIFANPTTRQKYRKLASTLKVHDPETKPSKESKDRKVPSHILAKLPSSSEISESSSPVFVEKISHKKGVVKKEEEKERRETYKRKQTPNPVTAKKKRKFL